MFVCISCGATFSKQFGKCNICQTWNCIVEKEVVEKNEFIRHRSKKGQSKHNEKTKTYQIIDDKALSEDRFYCWGCDGNCGALSHSHLIPGHELVATQKNIWLMGCGSSDSCHDRWESHNINEIKKIPNYKKALKVVSELDLKYYHKLMK